MKNKNVIKTFQICNILKLGPFLFVKKSENAWIYIKQLITI
jgi:hypothetical protein